MTNALESVALLRSHGSFFLEQTAENTDSDIDEAKREIGRHQQSYLVEGSAAGCPILRGDRALEPGEWCKVDVQEDQAHDDANDGHDDDVSGHSTHMADHH